MALFTAQNLKNTGPTPACRTGFDDGCSRQLLGEAGRLVLAAHKATDAGSGGRGSSSVETEKGLNAGVGPADVENLDVAVDERYSKDAGVADVVERNPAEDYGDDAKTKSR
ncbi:hypothetical protein MMC22_011582 [Lobaria immixta]|nr:hypothetical protein [Lobaria immixta]